MLTKKYIPGHKLAQVAAGANYDLMNAGNNTELAFNLKSLIKTDVGKMIFNLIGDLEPHIPLNGDKINRSHNLGLQLPPEFDFIHNSSVDPFQMIVIPFEHTFGKQDLIDMYQGIMPRISRFFEKTTKETAVTPSRPTPAFGSDVPPWLPYIPIGGISAEASYYKGLHKQVMQTSINSNPDLDGATLDEENFLQVMQAFKSLKDEPLPVHEGAEAAVEGGASYAAGEEQRAHEHAIFIFDQLGLDRDFAHNMDALQQIYDNYINSLNGQLLGPQQEAEGQSNIDKQTLENLGLENFLCPPLMSGVPIADHPIVQEYCDVTNSTIPNWTSKQFYENLRFMVFKVKQRSAKDYEKYRKRQIHQVLKKEHISATEITTEAQITIPGEKILENITFGEVYGSNWPYDYFSLLEAIKIDVEIKVAS